MSLRMLFLALAEMADALRQARRRGAVGATRRTQLGPYHVRADGTLRLVGETLTCPAATGISRT